ncbi:MAG: hypothetical protein JST11_03365 [Acidobacteria bacterium]|nr:hypothetical protein [Acidobacteriota bacterium]
MQMLLEAFLDNPVVCSLCMVNVPASQFVTLLLVARHFDPLARGKVFVLLDEQGRVAIVFKDQIELGQRFMKWATGGERVLTFGESLEAKALEEFCYEFEQAHSAITLSVGLVMLMRAGIEAEFTYVLNEYRNTDYAVRLSPETYVQDWIEFDEALRETAYLRWISSYLSVLFKYSLRPDGIIVLRRAADRIVAFQQSLHGQFVWAMPTPAPEYLPTADWLAGREALCLITDIVCRGDTVRSLLQQILRRYPPKNTRPIVTVFAPLLIDLAPPPLDSCVADTQWPGLSLLDAGEIGRFPLLWMQRTCTSRIETRPDDRDIAVPDRGSNILVDPTEPPDEVAFTPDIPASQFIRLAERLQAIAIGHLAVTGEHFDLEFDMNRLLREGSPVAAAFAERVAQSCVANRLDTLVFPDESRISQVIPLIEDELQSRMSPIPTWVRFRRDADGRIRVRARDRSALLTSTGVLIIDDAVNSGNTTRQMLGKVIALCKDLKVLVHYVVISRRSSEQEAIWREVTSLRDVKFEAKCLTHIPVGFFQSDNCPACRKRRLAAAYSRSITRPDIAPVMQDLARRLVPVPLYSQTVGLSAAEPPSRYAAPVLNAGEPAVEMFTTLSGAKAMAATTIGAQRVVTGDFCNRILELCAQSPYVAAYAFLRLASKGVGLTEIWEWPGIYDRFSQLAHVLGQEYADSRDSVNAEYAIRAIVDLANAVGLGRAGVAVSALGQLIRECSMMLNSRRVYQEFIFLAYRSPGSAKNDASLQKCFDDAWAVEKRPQPVVSVTGATERRGRLQTLSGILFGQRPADGWRDGLIALLERLSYIAGHEPIAYLNRNDRFMTQHLRNRVSAFVSTSASGSQVPTSEASALLAQAQRTYAAPVTDLEHLADGFDASVGSWLRLLAASKLLPASQLADCEHDLLTAQADATELIRAIERVRALGARGDLLGLGEALRLACESQARLWRIVYGMLDEGAPSLLRRVVEGNLSPVHAIARRFSVDAVEFALNRDPNKERTISVSGSFFEYARRVEMRLAKGEAGARSGVVLGGMTFVEEVLTNVIIRNPFEHVISKVSAKRIELVVDVDGLDSIDHKIQLLTEVIVDDRPVALPEQMWEGTLGRHRDLLSTLYGGRISTMQSKRDASISVVAIEFVVGHF